MPGSYPGGMMRKFLLSLALCAAASAQPAYRNPVVFGDYPDPSIIRVGDEYWATATSSSWAPEFPILSSRDLVNWHVRGAVFKERPDWAVRNFWAPEIVEYHGRYYVYYVAQKRNGPLSVAVASADQPQGPYVDHGPLISQPDGSIDAAPAVDVDGKRYLVWKEDGNSVRKPTPIWVQELAEDGFHLLGQPHEILRNTEPWEGPLIEAPYVQRHGDYLYLFYSGNACCGKDCLYAVGVARAKSLLGPWEKCPANPILTSNTEFKCPGHGSLVTRPDGRTFFFYHAMTRRGGHFVGRQAMLDEVVWGADGWPSINSGRGPSLHGPLAVRQPHPEASYAETFRGSLLPGWEWPQGQQQAFSLDARGLHLHSGQVLGRRTVSGDYVAVAALQPGAGRAGLAAYGSPRDSVGLSAGRESLELWSVRNGKKQVVWRSKSPSGPIELKLRTRQGTRYQFSFREPGGAWNSAGPEVHRGDLPPWDLGIRVALIGEHDGSTVQWFRMQNRDAKL